MEKRVRRLGTNERFDSDVGTVSTEQGQNKLNVDVFMRCTTSFYLIGVMLFYCVLQLGGKLSSCRDLDVLKVPFSLLRLAF